MQAPVQLALWLLLSSILFVLLFAFGVLWFVYWIHSKNKKIAELETMVKKLTPKTSEQILQDIYERESKKRAT